MLLSASQDEYFERKPDLSPGLTGLVRCPSCLAVVTWWPILGISASLRSPVTLRLESTVKKWVQRHEPTIVEPATWLREASSCIYCIAVSIGVSIA